MTKVRLKLLLNLCGHQRIPWDPSDPSYKNRNKGRGCVEAFDWRGEVFAKWAKSRTAFGREILWSLWMLSREHLISSSAVPYRVNLVLVYTFTHVIPEAIFDLFFF